VEPAVLGVAVVALVLGAVERVEVALVLGAVERVEVAVIALVLIRGAAEGEALWGLRQRASMAM
jgi:hypothetical protein